MLLGDEVSEAKVNIIRVIAANMTLTVYSQAREAWRNSSHIKSG